MTLNLPRELMIRLIVLAFLSGVSVGVWFFLPYFILDLNGGLIAVGLISTIPGLVAALVQLYIGPIIDATKATKDLLVLGFIISSLSTIPLLFVSTVATAIVMVTLIEPFNSITIIWGVVNSVYLANLIPSKRRAGIMSIYSSFWYLGNILGSFLAGYLAPISWRYVFSVFTAITFATGMVLKLFLPKGTDATQHSRSPLIISDLFNVRKFFRIFRRLPALIRESPPDYASFCLAISVRSIGVSMVMPITAYFVAEILAVSKPMIAILTAIGTLARIVPSPFIGWIADRWGRKKVFTFGFILMMIYPIILISAQDMTLLYFAYLMMGLGWSCTQATWLAWQMELVPSPVGLFMGLQHFLNNISWAVGPSLGAYLGEYVGIGWGIGVTTLVELMGFFLLMKVPEKGLSQSDS